MNRQKRAIELFTEAELTRFLQAAQDHARALGGVFVLDESVVLAGPRREATYLRDEMVRAGVDDLADRIDPSEYAEGAYEELRRKIAAGEAPPSRVNPSVSDSSPAGDDELSRRLTALAHADFGPLLVDAIYYPGLQQLTAVLVGNERVIYTADGRRGE